MTALRHSRYHVDHLGISVFEYNPLRSTIHSLEIQVNRLFGSPSWSYLNKRREWLTETKGLLKSVYTTSVCNLLLTPSITKDVNSSRLVVVELRLTKLCWHGDNKKEHKCCKWEVVMFKELQTFWRFLYSSGPYIVLNQSIGIDETNTFQLKFFI